MTQYITPKGTGKSYLNNGYKDSESDGYGYAKRRILGLRGLGFIPNTPLPGALGVGAGAPGTAGASCAACPPGCRTETRAAVYFARPQRTSDSDVAIKVSRKIVKCEDVSGVPQIACNQGVNGLSGLNGCSSCSGNYSNRM